MNVFLIEWKMDPTFLIVSKYIDVVVEVLINDTPNNQQCILTDQGIHNDTMNEKM